MVGIMYDRWKCHYVIQTILKCESSNQAIYQCYGRTHHNLELRVLCCVIHGYADNNEMDLADISVF